MFKPVDKKRFSEQVVRMIQERILGGDLKVGSKLPTERELAKSFQVSRTVIREALRELELAGFVRIKKGPKGGIFIDHSYHKPFSSSLKLLVSSGWIKVEHILEVRLLMEPYIASQAAVRAKRDELERLKSLVEESKRLEDAEKLKKNNMTFHILIADSSGNPVFSMLIRSVMEILGEVAKDFLSLEVEKEFLKRHEVILSLLLERKEKEVEKAVREDILFVDEKLKAFLFSQKKSSDM